MKERFCVRALFEQAFARQGAAMAVDGSPGTFWASKLDDTKGPVEFIIDFGEEQQLQFMEIDWEFPARGFAISLSVDGDHFNEAFATDANILKHFRSGLGSKLARKLRITMYEVRVRQLCIWMLPSKARRRTRVYRKSAFELRLVLPGYVYMLLYVRALCSDAVLFAYL